MDTSSDHYAVLGVGRTEGPEGIRHAFRALVTRYHPDQAGEGASSRYEDIVEAWRVLSSPVERAGYDREHPQASGSRLPLRSAEGSEAAPSLAALSLFQDFQAPGSALAETFERLVRNFTGIHVPKSEHLQPLELEVVLTPEQLSRGGTLRVAIPTFRTCPVCEGTGSHWLFPCVACDKQGLIEDREEARLIIPPGTVAGARYDVPLHGLGIHNLSLRVQLRSSDD